MKRMKQNAGFTLVELVVVIAILGILAGVGTAGYGAYVKHAQKNADMTTVSNIKRALALSTYVPEFTDEGPMQMANQGVRFPLGFIMLTNEGNDAGGVKVYSEALQSGTDTTGKPCEMVEGTFYDKDRDFTEKTSGSGWSKKTWYEPIAGAGKKITYCKTCTTLYDSINQQNIETGTTWYGYSYTKYPMESGSTLYEDHVDGVSRNPEYGAFTPDYNGTLHDALVAAYGEGYASTLKLESADWTQSAVPTFYANATSTWEEIKKLSETVINLQKYDDKELPIVGKVDLFKGNYADGADLVTSFAGQITTNRDLFLKEWEEQGTRTDGEEKAKDAFGNSGGGAREFYCAARTAYNQSFASYVSSTNPHAGKDGTAERHIQNIKNYGEAVIGDLDFLGTLPKSVSAYSFAEGGALECETCAQLFDTYVSSGAAKENGISIADTMVTINETSSAANEYAKDNSALFFDYYNSYLKEFEGLYTQVKNKTQGKSAIVITVYSQGGSLTTEVSPLDADPTYVAPAT